MDGTLKVVLISAAVTGAMLLVVFLYVRSLIPKEVLDNWGDIKKHMDNAEWVHEQIEWIKAQPWYRYLPKKWGGLFFVMGWV